MIGKDILKEMEQQVVQIKQNLKIAHDRQKIYTVERGLLRSSKKGIMCISELDPEKFPLELEPMPRWYLSIVEPLKFWIEWDS
jgi:hypothetical protein